MYNIMTQTKFQHIALIGKYQSPNSRELLAAIAELLPRFGAHVFIEEESAQDAGLEAKHPTLALTQIGKQCDLVIVAGGDGTMLRAARYLASSGIPLVGINQGRLGFITDITPAVYREALTQILSGDYVQDERHMMKAQVWRQNKEIFSAFALNEVVINRGSTSDMIEVRVEVGDYLVANLRADGVIMATPTGSTAYALSANGPILSPGIKGWVLVPIAPHTLSNRPIVLPHDNTICMELIAGQQASVSFDNQSLDNLEHHDRITIKKAKQKVRFLHPADWSYYETLRHKLRWYAE